MKLLIITSVKEFEKEIKQILKKAEVKRFSYQDVNGFSDASGEAIEGNWFASERHTNESLLFYAFVPKENVAKVFDLVAQFNAKQETASHIHLAMLPIERSN